MKTSCRFTTVHEFDAKNLPRRAVVTTETQDVATPARGTSPPTTNKSPSAPFLQPAILRPRSGTVLHDSEFHTGDNPGPSPPLLRSSSNARRYRPPVTVYSASVPLESLARLNRSFVGAPPLRLAAFRRLLDAATPQTKEQEFGSAFVFGAGDGAYNEAEGVGGGFEVAGKAVIAGGQGGSESNRREHSVLAVAGDGRGLERAGCLIEVRFSFGAEYVNGRR